MRYKKTKKMLALEQKHNLKLEAVLPDMVTEYGVSATADKLGVSKATLSYWLLKLRIEVKRIAVAPGDDLKLKRFDDAQYRQV